MLRRIKNLVLRSVEPRLSTTDTDHRNAYAWFERRAENYDRLINSVVPYLDPERAIFDVGANIGYMSLRLMERIRFRGSCYLFEPVPNLAQLCRQTFASKDFNVNVFNHGLSDKDGTVKLFIAQNGNIGWNTIIAEKSSAGMKPLEIQVRRYDDLGLDAHPQFIKIDVEGAEYLVLRGMMASLAKWNPLPIILCEIGWGTQHPNWNDELTVFTQLQGLGYRVGDLQGEKLDVTQLKQTTDVLFLPPGR
jgi:FkbM family methyltransferase